MKSIYKIYKKFRKHRQDEIKQIVRAEIIQETIKQKALKNKEILLNSSFRKEKIIVSLTTHSQRITSVYLAIESIAQQTLKPDKIILWLSQDDFNEKKLPLTLKRLLSRGLTINYRKDLGPYTKLIYALKEYPNNIIISIDDDIIYPIDLIENLYKTYLENPSHICCNVARFIRKSRDKEFLPYNQWAKIFNKKTIAKELLPLGVNGILYFPNCFTPEVFNIEYFRKLCPKSDDIWFKTMSLLSNNKTVVSGFYPNFTNSFIPLDSSYINALAVDNILNNENTKQFKAVIDYYKLEF